MLLLHMHMIDISTQQMRYLQSDRGALKQMKLRVNVMERSWSHGEGEVKDISQNFFQSVIHEQMPERS